MMIFPFWKPPRSDSKPKGSQCESRNPHPPLNLHNFSYPHFCNWRIRGKLGALQVLKIFSSFLEHKNFFLRNVFIIKIGGFLCKIEKWVKYIGQLFGLNLCY